MTTTSTAVGTARTESWFVSDLRKVAAAASAGFVLGFVVNGWGSRLAMMLLARLNPEDAGRLSDDGFVMGRFDLVDTLGLVFFATILGVLGGLLFLVVRDLRVGPDWFRTASMTVGPAVVVGALLVHTDGIDFTQLEPAWLAIALFVALPGLFAYGMVKLGDHWLREDSWFMRTDRAWTVGLLPVLLLGPALVLVVAGAAVRALHQRVPVLNEATSNSMIPNAARVVIAGIFGLALVDLIRDTAALV